MTPLSEAQKPSTAQQALQHRLVQAFDRTLSFVPNADKLFALRPLINGAFIKLGAHYRGPNFRNLFNKTICPVVPPNAVQGCTYFDVFLDLDEGLTPYCYLRGLLVRRLPVWVHETKLGYRFITDTVDDAPLVKATFVRVVLQAGTTEGLHGEIISNWFCHNMLLEQSNLAMDASTLDKLLDFAVRQPGKTVVRYQPVDKTKAELVDPKEFKLIPLPQ
jgi:hypothetical protein